MSSSDSLLPLLNQLQVMEDTLVNFMCETIMKLQSLTDVKVFLLVDYSQQNKRRYCGSKELVETFQRKEGPYFCMASDVEVELDKSASGLIEKQPWKRSSQVNGSAKPSGTPSTPGHPSIPAYNDHFSNTSPINTSPMLKRNSTNATLVYPDDACVPSKKQRSNSYEPELFQNSSEVKEESAEFPEYVISDDEEVDDCATFTIQNDALPNSGVLPLANDSLEIGLHGEDMGLNHNVDILAESQSFFHSLEAPEREQVKVNSLLGLPDPGVLFKKGTMENRLFISVCYSVGKNAALNCPYPFIPENKAAVQNYWSHHCDLFVNFCSRRGLFVDKSQINVETMDCLRKNTVAGFIRHRIRDGFKKVATRGQGTF